MDSWLISVAPTLVVIYVASRYLPQQFQLLGRFSISLPLGLICFMALLGIFDVIHHLVGLVLHLGLKFLLWLFYRYEFTFHPIEYGEHFWTSHIAKLTPRMLRRQDSGHLGLAFAIDWFGVVTIFFARESKRVTSKEAFKTVLRDQVYVLDRLYSILSGFVELLGKFVRRAGRFVADKQMQEAIKKAAQKAASERL